MLATLRHRLHEAFVRWAVPVRAPEPAPIIETPFRMSATPGTIRTRPPILGEHTDVVLGELGYDDAQIAALRERHVI